MGNVVELRSVENPAETLTDAALLDKVGNGETAALGLLFRRYNQMVYRFLARMAPLDHNDLDDLVQNTFLAAGQSARRYRGDSSVVTWLFAIAANVMKNHIRVESRKRRVMAAMTLEPALPAEGSPESLLAQRKAMALLAHALSGMSHKLKVVFVMCDLEGVSGVEVARSLNLREGTVWRRLHEARKQLRRALEKEGGRP